MMPTAITAQSGAQIKQSTRISVTGCPVRIVSHASRTQAPSGQTVAPGA